MSPKLRETVDYFIVQSKKARLPLTNKKLQKLVYYAQAWNLVFNNDKLFDEPIEAWIHGPVVPIVYNEYKKYGRGRIDEDVEFDPSKFTEAELNTLDEVWKAYGKFDGDYLEMLTHSEEPWSSARGEAEINERTTAEIKPEIMRVFYTDLLHSTKNQSI